jgi:predicted esterase
LKDTFPKDALVLAPNGLFPIPQRTEAGYKVGFSWYFYDPTPQEYFVDMNPAIYFLKAGIEKLGLAALPKRIIGFSQGGYLAPLAATKLGSVKQVIGIASEYLSDEIEGSIAFRADSVAGENDEIVKLEESRLAHQKFVKRAPAGEFFAIPGVGHKIESKVQAQIKILLAH